MAVTALAIKTCTPYAPGTARGDVGSYQQLDGTVHCAVAPEHSSNAGSTDLRRPPRDAHGLAQCSAECCLLQAATPHVGTGHHRADRPVLRPVLERGGQRARIAGRTER